MTGEDADLRDLERRYGRHGDPDVGARWLVARTRAGTLDADVGRDAAWAGDEVARRANPDVVPHDDPQDPAGLVRGLGSRSGAVLAAAVAMEELLALSRSQRRQRSGVDSGARSRELVAGIRQAELAPVEERARRHLACARLVTASGPDRGVTSLEHVVATQLSRVEPGDLLLVDLVRLASAPSAADAIQGAATLVAAVASPGGSAAEGAVLDERGRRQLARAVYARVALLLRNRPYHEPGQER